MKLYRKQVANMTFDYCVADKFEKLSIYSYATKIVQMRFDFDGLDIEVDGNFYSSSSTKHLGIALAIVKSAQFDDLHIDDIFRIIHHSKSLHDLTRFFGYVGKKEKERLFTDKAFLYIY